jgi:hypothetical protein
VLWAGGAEQTSEATVWGRDAMNAPLPAATDVPVISCGMIPRSKSRDYMPTSTGPRV